MPIRPLRVSDLQRVPQVPRLRAIVVPPPLPKRPHAAPPPLPARAARRLPLNWKAVGVAGMAGMLLVSGALAWAATHPNRHTRAVPFTMPDVAAVADNSARTTAETPVVVVHPEPFETTESTTWPGTPRPDPKPEPPAPALAAPPRVQALAAAALAQGGAPTCHTFGTSVDFDPNPAHAAQQAAKTQKLLMVLHVSGNFEESAFT